MREQIFLFLYNLKVITLSAVVCKCLEYLTNWQFHDDDCLFKYKDAKNEPLFLTIFLDYLVVKIYL